MTVAEGFTDAAIGWMAEWRAYQTLIAKHDALVREVTAADEKVSVAKARLRDCISGETTLAGAVVDHFSIVTVEIIKARGQVIVRVAARR